MKHTASARYPAPAAVIIRMFTDAAYHTRKLDAMGLKKYTVLDQQTHGDDFSIRIERKVPMQIPGTKKAAGETTVVNEKCWNRKTRCGHVNVHPHGMPLEMSCLPVQYAAAKVSAEKAAQLDGPKYTCMGAECADSSDGVPVFTGKYVGSWPGMKHKQGYGPFADEKPLFTIIVQNTAKYAVTSEVIHYGLGVTDATGSTPSLFPQSGLEAVWNVINPFHAWTEKVTYDFADVYAGGKIGWGRIHFMTMNLGNNPNPSQRASYQDKINSYFSESSRNRVGNCP